MFLRQALQSRLVTVYVDSEQYTAALSIASPLLKELKKIDDKALLVEVGVAINLLCVCYVGVAIS